MKEIDTKCPLCDSTEIGLGYQSSSGTMTPMGKFVGSTVIADVCTQCGYIISMKVSNPKRFKNTR